MNVARLPTWRAHLACYLIEAAGLGTFMLVAGIVAAGLASLPEPLHTALSQHPERGRMAFGVLMGLTVIMLVYSPWGRRSGAHLNPAVTATFYALGKIDALDALFYAIAQFAGGAIGFAFVAFMLHNTLAKPSIHFITTRPGEIGVWGAFLAEFCLALLLMTIILQISNSRFTSYTGIAAGTIVALYVTFEAPLSGMSLNPARTLASAIPGGDWTSIWIYFVAPPLGMLCAGFLYVTFGSRAVRCAKIVHPLHDPSCIFHCSYRHAKKQRSYHRSQRIGHR